MAMAMATTSKISNPLMYNWSGPPINEKKPSLRMNRSFRLRTRSLLTETEVTDTVESQSLVRRLILLRHAKSSWEYPSLRGIHLTNFVLTHLLHYLHTQHKRLYAFFLKLNHSKCHNFN